MADRTLLCGLAAATFLMIPAVAGAADTGSVMPSTDSVLPPARSGTLVPMPLPPEPGADQVNASDEALGNPANTPVPGALQLDRITGGEVPPSLEALQDTRPNDETGDDLKPGRREQLRQAALTYGAQGGQAARAFAINEMLRHNEPVLDTTFDFRPFVLPVGDGQTLMQPPIVSQAQMAFALNDTGTIAHESRCVFEITREAQLTSAAPNWRTYLVRSWNRPRHPAASALPHTEKEVRHWDDWVAEGWAAGEKVAVEIYLSDLSRLQRDITGMARYRVLLRAGRVEEPRVVFENHQAVGGGDTLHLGDRVIRITGQPGLQARTRVAYPEDCR